MSEQAISQSKLPTPVALYRHFDAAGRLLYVGISLSAVYRLSQHMDGSPWADEIESVKIQRFLTREEAHAAEREAIRTENPAHNKRRYAEPPPFTFTLIQTPRGAFGTYTICECSLDESENIVRRPLFTFRAIEGLGLSPSADELSKLAARVIRGEIASEEPWVFGTPMATPTAPQPGA